MKGAIVATLVLAVTVPALAAAAPLYRCSESGQVSSSCCCPQDGSCACCEAEPLSLEGVVAAGSQAPCPPSLAHQGHTWAGDGTLAPAALPAPSSDHRMATATRLSGDCPLRI